MARLSIRRNRIFLVSLFFTVIVFLEAFLEICGSAVGRAWLMAGTLVAPGTWPVRCGSYIVSVLAPPLSFFACAVIFCSVPFFEWAFLYGPGRWPKEG